MRKRISLNWSMPLVTVSLLLQSPSGLAAAPAPDAQAQARATILGSRLTPDAGSATHAAVPTPAADADAALAARALIVGSPDSQGLRLRLQALQARVEPFAGLRARNVAREDAQVQARRLLHGGAA